MIETGDAKSPDGHVLKFQDSSSRLCTAIRTNDHLSHGVCSGIVGPHRDPIFDYVAFHTCRVSSLRLDVHKTLQAVFGRGTASPLLTNNCVSIIRIDLLPGVSELSQVGLWREVVRRSAS